jgi:hypothetical protein
MRKSDSLTIVDIINKDKRSPDSGRRIVDG